MSENQERRHELGHFLRSRRERLIPSDHALPTGTRRRTPGLRREELADLAAVSPSWYTWLEQGRDITASTDALERIAGALRLDRAERHYLFALARAELRLEPQVVALQLEAGLQGMLDGFSPNPAFILNARWDVVAWNELARQVFADFPALDEGNRNILRLIFTDPSQRSRYEDWECIAARTVAMFRASLAQTSDQSGVNVIVGELAEVSPAFRALWARHEVDEVHNSRKTILHPELGRLVLQSTTLLLAGEPGLRLFLYTPLPEEQTLEKLRRLEAMRDMRPALG